MDKEIEEKINRKVVRSFMPEEILKIIKTKGRALLEITHNLKWGNESDMMILERQEEYFKNLNVPYVLIEKPTNRTPELIIMKERRA